ncbi:tyrosine-type recombinase/integrase [Deinococcus sp. VB343]|uniref:tyrosine-type recombinase/integrase n=1 Tax=Deinococcus sp. VB343 TaxID=3385567 RepID=UPI0039C8E87E
MAKNPPQNITRLPSGSYRWRKRVLLADGTSVRLTGTAKTRLEAERDMIDRAAEARRQDRKTVQDKQPAIADLSNDAVTALELKRVHSVSDAQHALTARKQPDQLTVADLVIEHMEAMQAKWSVATRLHNEGWFIRHIKPALGNLKASELTPAMLRRFYDDRSQLSHSARNQLKCLLNGAYKRAQQTGLLTFNPVAIQPIGIKRAKSTRVKYFEPQDAIAFNAVAKHDRFGMILSFLLLTGMRLGEACGLHWSDIAEQPTQSAEAMEQVWGVDIHRNRTERPDPSGKEPTKTDSSTRYIYVSQEVHDLLLALKAQQEIEAELHGRRDPHVFLSTTGYPVVGWNYARQETPRGRDSHARSVQTRSVSPIAIAGVRWRYC